MFCSEPFFWKSVTRPGCETAARSGGLPPATAVARTVGVLSPVDLYDTLTSGFAFLKPSRTALNDFSSSPVHTPTIETVPETDFFVDLALANAVTAASRTTPSSAAMTSLLGALTLVLLPWRNRFRYRSGGRRNGVRGCRRLPSPRRL